MQSDVSLEANRLSHNTTLQTHISNQCQPLSHTKPQILLNSLPIYTPNPHPQKMSETLTQKSRRRETAQFAITLVKVAIIKAWHSQYWRGGAFHSIKTISSNVDIDLERLEESDVINEAERAVFKDTRLRIGHVVAYMEGRPTELSSVEDLGWVRRLRSVFEGEFEDREGGKGSGVRGCRTIAKTVSEEKDDGDGFEIQKVYGGSRRP